MIFHRSSVDGAGARWRVCRRQLDKEAATVGGERRLAATSQDISMDVAAGALELL